QLDRAPVLDLGAYEFTHVRASWSGSATPGGLVTIALDGDLVLPTVMIVGVGETTLRFAPHGWLFVDLASFFVLVTWPSAPSSVDVDVPADFPVPLSIFLQAFAFQGRAGNLSNSLEIDVE